MRKKKLAILLVLTLLITAFSGCMEIERGIKVGKDGDVECFTCVYMSESDMKYVYPTPEEFYAALEAKIDEGYPVESFEKLERESGGKTWYGARATYAMDSGSVEEELNEIYTDYEIEYEVSGFFVKKLTLTMNYVGESPLSMFADLMQNPEVEFKNLFTQTTSNVFSIQVPYPILSSNGKTVKGEKNMVSWDMSNVDSRSGSSITMTVTYVSGPLLVVIGIAVILILAVIVFFIVKAVRKSRRKKKEMQAAGMLQMQTMQPAQKSFVPDQTYMQQPAPSVSEPAPMAPDQPSRYAPPGAASIQRDPEPEDKQKYGDVPQVMGLPSIGQLPKTEEVKEETKPLWERTDSTSEEKEDPSWNEEDFN